MTSSKTGGDLFIVDNSISDWTGLEYLRQWTEIAKSFDIATGYFEIGSLLALEPGWQNLEKIRILMGDETTGGTKKALLEALSEKVTEKLDRSLERIKSPNPFLNGVPAIVEALRSGQIECRIYNRDKFHAKTYITHAKLDVIGSKALVGSSNFTRPGLTQNIELNIQVQSPGEVEELQEWYEEHWELAVEVTDDVIHVMEQHIRAYTPWDVYTKALSEYFKGREASDKVWEENESKMFPVLDQYQREAYWALLKIASQHHGAFLCDGVGLGKTFVGLMLIERLVRDKKHVVLFAPKGAKQAVWEPDIKKYLAHIGSKDFSNLAIFSHTDFNRKGDYPERFARIAEIADAVIVDEGHHFRNPGQMGDPETGEKRSRYYRFMDLMAGRKKDLYLLTATPINNRLTDFRHMIELFTQRNEAHFSRTIGVNHLRAHFNQLEKKLRDQLGERYEDEDLSEDLFEAQDILETSPIFEELVVQRSRAYAQESQKREYGEAASFPKRQTPKVAEYSVFKTYGRLLDLVEKAFERKGLLNLSFYNPFVHYIGDEEVDPFLKKRLQMVVSLIRTQFLKRFESSIYSFEMSCSRLIRKLLAFIEVHAQTPADKRKLTNWTFNHAEALGYTSDRQKELWGEDDDEEDELISEELLESIEVLDESNFDIGKIIDETFDDLDQLIEFLEETQKVKPAQDDKLKKLIRLIKSKDIGERKVLVFTEYADTARYIENQVKQSGIDGVERVDGGTAKNRLDIVQRFAPFYNGQSSDELEQAGRKEIRVLISTDVLSEGLNLQDATRLINYDIHWNPVRLMQRIGRVDRRMNPETEERLKLAHPEFEADRGKVYFWNFLPPDELNRLLSLYRTVTRKTVLISKTLGIEGRKLLTPDDDFEALREFNTNYEGTWSLEEEMHLELQELLKDDIELANNLESMPGAIFSGRQKPAKGTVGVFLCFGLPALDNETQEFTEEAGSVRWYLYEIDSGEIFEEPAQIISSIKCRPNTPRRCREEQETLIEIRGKVLKHITNGYLRQVNAPVGVDPTLKCWMEINGD